MLDGVTGEEVLEEGLGEGSDPMLGEWEAAGTARLV